MPSSIEMALWYKFNDECTRAQKERDKAIKVARADSEAILDYDKTKWTAFREVKAVLDKRCKARQEEADRVYEEACKQAEDELTKALAAASATIENSPIEVSLVEIEPVEVPAFRSPSAA
jgi:vacuolar-type H+-ATPase subunit H